MKSLNECMETYRNEIKKGDVKLAYKGLMDFFKELKTYFQYNCLDFSVTSNLYVGCMDLTFISFSTELLKQKKLKVAIVFIHDKGRFDIWLIGFNKNMQAKYLKLLKENNWDKYSLTSSTNNVTYIATSTLVETPDFDNLPSLTKKIEAGAVEFIHDFEGFLSEP